MIDVSKWISPQDLDKALDVIRGDAELRKAWTRLDGHKEQAEYLLRAAREARRLRLGDGVAA